MIYWLYNDHQKNDRSSTIMASMMSDSLWWLTLGVVSLLMHCSIQEELTASFSMNGRYSGFFTSPGYPKQYPKNVLYKWTFPGYTHDIILINFLEMDLYLCYVVNDLETCDGYDQVTVEGHGTFCNWRKPSQTIILVKETVIWFKTLNGTRKACRGKGFNATFKVTSATIYHKTIPPPTAIIPTNTATDHTSKEPYTSKSTITIIATVIVASLVITIVLVSILCWRYKKHQQQRRQRSSSRSYSSVPTDQVRYSELLRRSERETPQRGPPPTYDSVINPNASSSEAGQTLNATDLESPPSYETVIREVAPNQRRQAGAGRRYNQRPRGNETRGNGRSTEQSRSQTNIQRTGNAAPVSIRSSASGSDRNNDASDSNRSRTAPALRSQRSPDDPHHADSQVIPATGSTSRSNQPTNNNIVNTGSTSDQSRSRETSSRTPSTAAEGANPESSAASDVQTSSGSQEQSIQPIDRIESAVRRTGDNREVFV